MPQPRDEKILPQPQPASACRRHHKPMSAPPAALPIFSGVYHNKPIPPSLFNSPCSTEKLPGPTCSQPVRSFPLKSCCHCSARALPGRSVKARVRIARRLRRFTLHLRARIRSHQARHCTQKRRHFRACSCSHFRRLANAGRDATGCVPLLSRRLVLLITATATRQDGLGVLHTQFCRSSFTETA